MCVFNLGLRVEGYRGALDLRPQTLNLLDNKSIPGIPINLLVLSRV